ncbi:MAG TPA: protein kinase [Polyangia bacterium]|jgi:serine/threonine-protein kinase
MKHCPMCSRSFPGEERFCSVHGLPLVAAHAAAGEHAGEWTGHILDGRYQLGDVLGQGGMGVVYAAENLRIGRRCAVKLLHPALVADPKMRMRLFREVQAASRVRHPNIVEIWDFGEHEQLGSFLVMEFVEGTSLARRIVDDAPLALPLVCRIGVQLCAALAATHARGLIHRDLKPANVILTPAGVAKVLDFGLVKPFRADAGEDFAAVTTEGVVFGTPQYLSPEQVLDLPLDPRADIYSLGVVLYEMLVGRLPFTGHTIMEVIEGHRGRPVPMPSVVDPTLKLPAEAELILLRALAKEPKDRYPSMLAFRDALCGLAEAQGIRLAAEAAADDGAREAPADAPADAAPAPVAAGPDEATAPTVATLPVTLPWAVESIPLAELRDRALRQLDDLTDRTVAALRVAFPHYRGHDAASVRRRVVLVLKAAIESFAGEAPALPAELRAHLTQQAAAELPLAEVLGAVWLAYVMCRPLVLETAREDLHRYVELEGQLDRRLVPFFVGLVDVYVAWAHGRLVALNEALERRNEELQRLRAALAEEVQRTTTRLSESEGLKARVTESISSGLVLVERGSWRIVLFNRAMERLTGLPAAAVVGKSFEEVMHQVEGLPLDELVEQVRMHGEVGRRKARLRFPGGEQRTVYLRGEPFAAGETTGVLYVIDDVSERERIIENLGRYLSRDVVERILTDQSELQPAGESSVAAILAVQLRGFQPAALAIEEVVGLLNDYVRDVADAVFHHGGTIERITTAETVVYFSKLRGRTEPAVAAAVELAGRLARTAARRAAAGQPTVQAGLGMHLGEVLVLNVGGERLMVKTVAGEARLVAAAMAQAAGPGEVLVSPALRAGAATLAVEPGPAVEVAGAPAGTFRVLRPH